MADVASPHRNGVNRKVLVFTLVGVALVGVALSFMGVWMSLDRGNEGFADSFNDLFTQVVTSLVAALITLIAYFFRNDGQEASPKDV